MTITGLLLSCSHSPETSQSPWSLLVLPQNFSGCLHLFNSAELTLTEATALGTVLSGPRFVVSTCSLVVIHAGIKFILTWICSAGTTWKLKWSYNGTWNIQATVSRFCDRQVLLQPNSTWKTTPDSQQLCVKEARLCVSSMSSKQTEFPLSTQQRYYLFVAFQHPSAKTLTFT